MFFIIFKCIIIRFTFFKFILSFIISIGLFIIELCFFIPLNYIYLLFKIEVLIILFKIIFFSFFFRILKMNYCFIY
jgi:hypothetical protein